MEVYSFEDAVGYFEEEQILERQAKNIIEQERQKQQQAGNLRCPFVDLTNCTPIQKAVLNAHFQRVGLSNILYRNRIEKSSKFFFRREPSKRAHR